MQNSSPLRDLNPRPPDYMPSGLTAGTHGSDIFQVVALDTGERDILLVKGNANHARVTAPFLTADEFLKQPLLSEMKNVNSVVQGKSLLQLSDHLQVNSLGLRYFSIITCFCFCIRV